jgi:hypothetical protein
LQAHSSISRKWAPDADHRGRNSNAEAHSNKTQSARPLSAKQITRAIFKAAQRHAKNPELAGNAYSHPHRSSGQKQRIEQLSWQLQSKLEQCKPRQLANCIWAWAELGYSPPAELLAAVVHQILGTRGSSSKSTSGTSNSSSTGALGLPKAAAAGNNTSLDNEIAEVMDALAAHAIHSTPVSPTSTSMLRNEGQSRLNGAEASAVSQQQQQLSVAFLMQNIAKLRCADPSVWGPLLNIALHSLESGAATPVYLTNAAWAVAKLQQYAPNALTKAAAAALAGVTSSPAAALSATRPAPPFSLLQGLLSITTSLPQKLLHPQPQQPEQVLLQRLVTAAGQAAPACSPKQVSLLAWSLATLRPLLPSKQNSRSSFSLYGSSSRSSDAQLSAAFDALASAALRQAQTFKPQDISNMLWAFAVQQHPHAALFRALSEQLLSHSHQLNPQQISNSLWAMASLQLPHRDFIAAAVEQLVVILEGQCGGPVGGTADAATTAASAIGSGASATGALPLENGGLEGGLNELLSDAVNGSVTGDELGVGGKELQQMVGGGNAERVCHPKPSSGSSQNALLWMAQRGSSRAQSFVLQQQELITALHALAKLDHKSVRLMELASFFVMQQLGGVQAGEVGRQLKQQPSRQHLQHDFLHQQHVEQAAAEGGGEQLFQQRSLADILETEPGSKQLGVGQHRREQQQQLGVGLQLQPGDVSSLLWSCATLQYYHPSLFSTLADCAYRNFPSYSKTEVATVLWALALERHHHAQLLAATAAALVQDLGSVDRLGLTNILWAMATLGYKDDAFLQEVGLWVRQHVETFSAGDLVRVAWSYSILGELDLQLLDAVFREVGAQAEEKLHKISSKEGTLGEPLLPPLPAADPRQSISGSRGACDALGLTSVDYQQLYQVHLTLQDYALGESLAPDAVPCLPPMLLFPARWAWQAVQQQQGAVHVSQAALAVGQTLRQMGFSPRSEQLVADGAFRVDWALTWLGAPVVVEVQGPWHYTRTLPRRLLGSSRWRLQQLRARGLTVVEVPLHVWGDLEGKREKQRYIMQLLQAHVLHGK